MLSFQTNSYVPKTNIPGLVAPNVEMYLGQQWLRQWPVAWQYQAIFWASVDFSSKVFCSIYLRIISVEMLNRKHEVYVYVNGENQSTLRKMNNYRRCEYK